jgi:hypothetical protein
MWRYCIKIIPQKWRFFLEEEIKTERMHIKLLIDMHGCFYSARAVLGRDCQSSPDWNLVLLSSTNSRDAARAHAFVLEVVLERRRFSDHFRLIPRRV